MFVNNAGTLRLAGPATLGNGDAQSLHRVIIEVRDEVLSKIDATRYLARGPLTVQDAPMNTFSARELAETPCWMRYARRPPAGADVPNGSRDPAATFTNNRTLGKDSPAFCALGGESRIVVGRTSEGTLIHRLGAFGNDADNWPAPPDVVLRKRAEKGASLISSGEWLTRDPHVGGAGEGLLSQTKEIQ